MCLILYLFIYCSVTDEPGVEFDVSVKNGVIIKAGEMLRIPAYVIGRPIPEVKWTKDDAEPDKERVVIETVGKNSTLNIKNALRSDHGKYEITGTNSSGTKSAFIRVDVMGKNLTCRNAETSDGF